MLFLLNNKGNHNLIKHQIASKYLNLNFYTIKLFVHHALFIINELLANGKNSLKQKIEEFIACFNELNVYFLNEETQEYTIFKRKDFVKHNGKEYRLEWSEQMENSEYNQEHFEDQQYVYDESCEWEYEWGDKVRDDREKAYEEQYACGDAPYPLSLRSLPEKCGDRPIDACCKDQGKYEMQDNVHHMKDNSTLEQ